MFSYKDQFAPAEPIFTVISTMDEWALAESDLGKQLHADKIEDAEFNSASVVHDLLMGFKNGKD